MEKEVQDVFDSVLNDFKKNKSKFQIKQKAITSDINEIQTKIIENVKKNCKDMIDWLKNNSTKKYNENNESVYNFPDQIKEEFKKISEDLDKCSEKYEYGFRNEVNSREVDKFNIYEKFKNDTNSCISQYKDQSKDELRKCFQSCFNEYYLSIEQSDNRMRIKIEELNRNLNKI